MNRDLAAQADIARFQAEAALSASAPSFEKSEVQQNRAMSELSQGFVDKFGFEVIVKPDSAGRAIYGKDKFTLELRIPQPEEASAVGDAVTFLDPYTVSYNEDGEGQILSTTASYMHKSRVTADTQTITALNTAFPLGANTHAWIEIAVTSVAPTAAELKTGTAFPELVVTSVAPPVAQTQYNLPVGRVVSDAQPGMPGFDFTIDDDPYHWQQLLQRHQLLKIECFSGKPIVASTDWQGI